jgi:hypothetical protein
VIVIECSRFFSIGYVYGGFSWKGRIAGLLSLIKNVIVFEGIKSQNGHISDVFNLIRLGVLEGLSTKITAKIDPAGDKNSGSINKVGGELPSLPD